MKNELEKLLRDAVLEESYMLRLYDLAEKSRDETQIEVRAHAAAVVSLHLAWEVEQHLAAGGQDELMMRSFANLAVAQTSLSRALDSVRTFSLREDSELFTTFLAPLIEQTNALEKLCGDAVDKVMERGDMSDEDERVALDEALVAAQKAIPLGREIATKFSQVVLLSTATGATRN